MRIRAIAASLAAAIPSFVLLYVPGSFAVEAPAAYRDAKRPVPERVEDLLARMTLEEKIAQMISVWGGKAELMDARGRIDAAKLKQRYPHGLGQFARPSDASGPASPREVPGRDPRATVALVNTLQHYALEQTRLGIPILFHEEGLHGYAALGATSFPQAIALASSWDPDLVREVNATTAREIRARGVHLALTPVVDIARDPRWGRIEETFGEDPYLAGEMGVAAVEGLQGLGGIRTLGPGKVFATLKHMTGHGQPESGTNIGPAPISERELRTNFLYPFEQVVRRTGISAVMPSYNEIDGVPSHANRWLLNDVLRKEWGFDGVVVSDYYAIEQMAQIHGIAADAAAAAPRALAAGVDQDLPDGGAYQFLPQALQAGQASLAQIDAAVRRILSLKFRAGLFEHPYADAAEAVRVTNDAAARALARRAAARSMILLKNDGMLPLQLPAAGGKPMTIAVVGPSSAVARLGGYYGQPPHTVSILEGLRTHAGTRARILFAQGVKITENDDWWADKVDLADPGANRRLIEEAVRLAAQADRIVLTLGDTEQTSREAWADNHLGDRDSLDLIGEQQALFDALRALGKPMVVILINGRPASTVAIAQQSNALLEGWYLGEQTGSAVADVLFGAVNPGGKLPLTIPRSAGQLPAFYNAKPSARRGYLFDSAEPLFPFGFGLSYSRFEFAAPRLSAARIRAGESVDVTVGLRNSSQRAGDETVQVYVRDRVSSVTRPVKELKAFRRVSLQPGEQLAVTLTLDVRAFQMWNTAMQRVVEPGEFEILVGPNSAELQSVILAVVP